MSNIRFENSFKLEKVSKCRILSFNNGIVLNNTAWKFLKFRKINKYRNDCYFRNYSHTLFK